MNYNKLTPQEERVIIHKATEPAFKGEYDFMKMEPLSVEDVMPLCFHQKVNLMQDAAGQVLMKVTQMQ